MYTATHTRHTFRSVRKYNDITDGASYVCFLLFSFVASI